jgi:hypothetical protein
LLATLDTELCRDRLAAVPLSAVRNSLTLALAEVLAPLALRPAAPAVATAGGRSPRVVRTVEVLRPLAADPGRGGTVRDDDAVTLVPVRTDEAADRGRACGGGVTFTLATDLAYLDVGVVAPLTLLALLLPGDGGTGTARVGTGGFFAAAIVGEGGVLPFPLVLPCGVSFESGRSPMSPSSSSGVSLRALTLRAPRGVGMLRLSTLTRMLLCWVWILRLCWSASWGEVSLLFRIIAAETYFCGKQRSRLAGG